MMMKATRFLSFLLLLVPMTCHGWGTIGHEVVANVAWAGLSQEARAWVTTILLSNDTVSTSTASLANGNGHAKKESRRKAVKAIEQEDNSPLGMVADWADQVRHFLPWSAPLHYIDVRDDLFAHGCHVDPYLNPQCRFLYERDCPNDICVAGAIVNYTHQLAQLAQLSQPQEDLQPPLRGIHRASSTLGTTGSNKATKEALMFLTHFIGDIHQPLHCSRLTDKGGNDIHVHFHLPPIMSVTADTRTIRRIRGHHHSSWNLHSVWDSGLIEVALARDYNNSRLLLEQHLIAQLDTAKETYLKDCDPALGANRNCTTLWGQQSWDNAVRYAYTMSDNRTDVTDGSTLDEQYFQTRWPLAMDRLLAGAVRLAGTLEWLVQQNNQTIGTAKASITTSIDQAISPSFWTKLFPNAWSWTLKSRMLAFSPSYYF